VSIEESVRVVIEEAGERGPDAPLCKVIETHEFAAALRLSPTRLALGMELSASKRTSVHDTSPQDFTLPFKPHPKRNTMYDPWK